MAIEILSRVISTFFVRMIRPEDKKTIANFSVKELQMLLS
jgi:hypothetical protein